MIRIQYSRNHSEFKNPMPVEVSATNEEYAKREVCYRFRKKYNLKDWQNVYLCSQVYEIDKSEPQEQSNQLTLDL